MRAVVVNFEAYLQSEKMYNGLRFNLCVAFAGNFTLHGIYFYSTFLYESILFWNPSTSLLRLARVFRPDGGDVMQRPVQHGGGHQLDSQRQLCGQQDLLSAWPLQLPVDREQVWGEDSLVCGHYFWTLSL